VYGVPAERISVTPLQRIDLSGGKHPLVHRLNMLRKVAILRLEYLRYGRTCEQLVPNPLQRSLYVSGTA
jgi:hypothetical protein